MRSFLAAIVVATVLAIGFAVVLGSFQKPAEAEHGGRVSLDGNGSIACLYRKLDSAITVMKSADNRRRYDVAQVLDSPMDRSVLVERPMCPQFVIIGGLAPEKYNSIAHWPC
jgi:hypothetical protein